MAGSMGHQRQVSGLKQPWRFSLDLEPVAVKALTEDGHAGQLYELTGPRLMTFEEAVGEIARATGRPIRYVPISIDEYKLLLTEYQVPADFVWLVEYLFTKVLDGRNAHVADGVRRALGREPRDFSQYARDAAAAGAWSAPATEDAVHGATVRG